MNTGISYDYIRGASFNKDGRFLAIGLEGEPFFKLLTFNKGIIDNFMAFYPTISGPGMGVAFDKKDNATIAVAHRTVPYLSIYKLSLRGEFISAITLADSLMQNAKYFGVAIGDATTGEEATMEVMLAE